MTQRQRRIKTAHTSTRCVVSFHTHDPQGFDVVDPIMDHPEFGSIVGVSTGKTMGAASGQFTITVKKPSSFGPRSFLRLWRDPEEVWVSIKFVCDGQTIDTMFGQIDAINESTTRAGLGERADTYEIVGRDFGKMFETVSVWMNLADSSGAVALHTAASLYYANSNAIVGTPSHFMRVLMETWLGNNRASVQQFSLPPSAPYTTFGNSLYSALNLDFLQTMTRDVNGIAQNTSLVQPDGDGTSLWESMQAWSNGTMNELFVDLGPPNDLSDADDQSYRQPCVFFRERPFPWRSDDGTQNNRSKWDRLPTHDLRLEDIVNRTMAKGGAANRFNYWVLNPTGIGTERYGLQFTMQDSNIAGVDPGHPGNLPIWNNQSIQRHGLRQRIASTNFVPATTLSRDPQAWLPMLGRWLKKIHDWFAPAPYQLSGNITTSRVFPEIRIGHRVREWRTEGNILYYVEAVNHSWSFPGAGTTQITLTRGEYEDEDLLDYVYEQYAGNAALAPEDVLLVNPSKWKAMSREDRWEFVLRGGRVQAHEPGKDGSKSVSAPEEGTPDVGRTDQTQPTLEVERDGTVAREDAPDTLVTAGGEMDPVLDDSGPSIETPSNPDATTSRSGEGPLDREALERGYPVGTEDP